MSMELIPGLPDDVARDCLIRVGYSQFQAIVSVCKGWKTEIESPEFRQFRKDACTSQKLFVMAQARVDRNQNSGSVKNRFSPVYRLTVLEPESGCWCELSPIPGFTDGLPMFCHVANVGLDLVVLGGLDPVTWDVSTSVFVYNFMSATWRRGADMPGVQRSFFGCASDFNRTVYVVGGHDREKNALRSAMEYDVEKDKWVPLPDMANARDECNAIFLSGRLHVIGGYRTERQGRFEATAEVFDVATWQWDQVQENFLEASMCPRTCVCDVDGEFLMCRGGDVVARKGTTWQSVAKLPADVCNAAYVAKWQGKLLVIGSGGFSEPHVAYVLDSNYQWTKLETPGLYSGHVQSGCYLEI